MQVLLLNAVSPDNGPVDYLPVFFLLLLAIGLGASQLLISAILGNLAFITYAYYQGVTPILVLHAILLPINSLRLTQLVRRRGPKE